jgi:hypothetical protein
MQAQRKMPAMMVHCLTTSNAEKTNDFARCTREALVAEANGYEMKAHANPVTTTIHDPMMKASVAEIRN